MKDVAALLDAAKAAQGIDSDSGLARALGVTRGSVSNWRKGVSLPDAVACAALAGLTGEPLAKVLGTVGEARAISREEKAVWRKLAATAALILMVALPWSNPAAAYTRGEGQKTFTNQHFMYYAKWWTLATTFIRRMFRLNSGNSSAALLA